jgi:hypothetical protein
MNKLSASLALAGALTAGIASAQSTFQAILTGAGENPANASTATGFGTVVLNAASNQITVNLSFSGLIGGTASAAHIHGPGGVGTVATNASVIFPFTGVPAATSGSIPEQTFAINATQIGWLFSNYLYMNVHNLTFQGGEIRGQLTLVPEPSAVALCGLGIAAAAWRLRRRSRLQDTSPD